MFRRLINHKRGSRHFIQDQSVPGGAPREPPIVGGGERSPARPGISKGIAGPASKKASHLPMRTFATARGTVSSARPSSGSCSKRIACGQLEVRTAITSVRTAWDCRSPHERGLVPRVRRRRGAGRPAIVRHSCGLLNQRYKAKHGNSPPTVYRCPSRRELPCTILVLSPKFMGPSRTS